MAQAKNSEDSEVAKRRGRNGFGSSERRRRIWVSHLARRREEAEALSTSFRAKGEEAEESETESWTRKTVPVAPLPRSLRALIWSRSSFVADVSIERKRGSYVVKGRRRSGSETLRSCLLCVHALYIYTMIISIVLLYFFFVSLHYAILLN